jgi:hypothetical protein
MTDRARFGGPFDSSQTGKALTTQRLGGVQALMTSHGAGPTQRKRWGRRLSK